ncbi:MAG: glycosyltransferase family 39 protein [Halobacteriales archaeon]|nr:glycosyltransferase family 39 protein [Halobacteriales archaeon]
MPPRWPDAHPWLVAACLAAIALGIGLRAVSTLTFDLGSDGQSYAAMGDAFARSGSFVLPSGEWDDPHPGPGPSHHYPPLYPALLGAADALAGFSASTTHAASLLLSLAALGVVAWVLRDLLGPAAMLVGAAVVALDPQLIWATGTAYSENLVLLLFALTMWGILRSLERPWLMVAAGLFAGLAYLARSSMGALFLLGGIAGLAWRFHYVRWQVLRDKPYVVAIAVFLAMVAAWAGRNVRAFGWPQWQTSSYVASLQTCIVADVLGDCALHGGPAAARFGLALLAKLPFFAAMLALWLVPFLPEARASLRRILDQRESGAWLAVALVLLLGWLAAAMFWAAEDSPLWWADNRRYVLIASVPLLLAVLRHADFRARGFALRGIALLAVLAVASGPMTLAGAHFPESAAARALAPELQPGAVVAFDGNVSKYSFYADLGNVRPFLCTFQAARDQPAACPAAWLVTDETGRAACYEAQGFALRTDLSRTGDPAAWPSHEAQVWQRTAGPGGPC